MRIALATIIILFTSLSSAETIQLPEVQHGSVTLSYDVSTYQKIKMVWVDSNPQLPSTKVEWFPEPIYVRTHTPLVTLPGKGLEWKFEDGLHHIIAVAHFTNGDTTIYHFAVSVIRPEPVKAAYCRGPENCDDSPR